LARPGAPTSRPGPAVAADKLSSEQYWPVQKRYGSTTDSDLVIHVFLRRLGDKLASAACYLSLSRIIVPYFECLTLRDLPLRC
jgi:hypothetical protein